MTTNAENLQSAVLIVPATAVEGLFSSECFHDDPHVIGQALESIRTCGQFVNREWAEQRTTVKQIVAYAVIRCGRSVLCIRRGRQGNRDGLRLRYSILFGGHVDELDATSSDPISHCVGRELHEELGIVVRRSPEILGVVTDPSTHGGRLHLGVIFDVEIEAEFVDVEGTRDNSEFANSAETNRYELRPIEEFAKEARALDPWSSLFLCSHAADRIRSPNRPFHTQPPLPIEWPA